ncbi:O-antigen/teichoic acid export membrane protein [Algoriphagus ratkowskyi]|uniref:O-antigen/teichoic acid export membrane protein n=1 Tax=Algoriphagus ratkowskyi TaxID=57028 RepID=A0A2W7S401_9BACT|nr:oligosaccharide flippase family protein [Algoriphagus ratkowskyi]PZX57775.1 O-antigen/teichoic acid export membrane protein [Algoriphagus ratkowskyi]TXD79039.1 oligosaccharide flippase family protein [Algoriphagus ratkowskyi]
MSVLKNLKNLASDSLIYGLSGILTRFIGVFLTPIYTRVYTPDDYGVIGVLTNAFILITIFLVFAMDNSTARWFYDTEVSEERKRIINTWLWFYLFISVIATVFFFFTANYWAALVLDDYADGAYLIKLLALTLPLLVLPSIGVNVLRFERKARRAVFLSLYQSLILIGFNILFVVILKKGVAGVYYAQLWGAILTLPVAIYFLYTWIGLPSWFDWVKFKEMLRYALPFVPASLGYWVVNLSGVFFINEFLPKSEVGLYQIGISIAAVSALATTSFQQAWSPFAFSILSQPHAKEIYAASLQLYVFVIGFICTLISVFAFEALVLLTTPAYYGAALVASMLTFNYLLMGLTNIAGLGASIAKKTAPLGMISLLSAGLLVALNLFLIPLYGKEGAAFAICIAQLIIPIYMFWKSQQLYFIPYKFLKNLAVFAAFIACSIASYHLPIVGFFSTILLKVILLLVTFFLIAWVNKEELYKIKSILKVRYSVR